MKKNAIVNIGGKAFSVITYRDWLPIKLSAKDLKSKIVKHGERKYLIVSTGHLLVDEYLDDHKP